MMNAQITQESTPSLRERAQSWSGLAVNVFGGVGDLDSGGRSIAEIKAERTKAREARRARRR